MFPVVVALDLTRVVKTACNDFNRGQSLNQPCGGGGRGGDGQLPVGGDFGTG